MESHKSFTIYNASAGAGKTYTLVKAYLTALLYGEFKDSYKSILAITFTNKAVSEMKTRILQNLVILADPEKSNKDFSLLSDIIKETGINEKKIHQKAKKILASILHNYSAFDVVTIDTFTHRVIRTFAHDLGIPMNFEIEMDTETLLEESVSALISKVGTDNVYTKIIIDFALSKLEDDKSWDITTELNKIAKLLFSENDRAHLDKISDKTFDDFGELKKILYQKSTFVKNEIRSSSNEILNKIKENNIEHSDFTRGTIPGFFQKISNGQTKFDFTKTKWAQQIETTSFYNKSLDPTKKDRIDSLRPVIEKNFLIIKDQLSEIKLLDNIINNITPLSVLNAINKELLNIKKERSVLLISEFNKIISEAIQDQPAPFIYERLGERYRDYFIDEFQDTSELQWNNIIPLIDNAISTETLTGKRGKLTIVGDAKQAIYRWRGGKAEQFINLSLNQNPFSVKEKQLLNLPKNYRSHQEVINFNNNLFTYLSNDFSDELHKKLYLLGNNQEYNNNKDGYVNISFINAKNTIEENEIYPEKVYDSVLDLQQKGYKLGEICILTRRQKEGTAIADFLTEKGLSIISSETLLIQNDPRVNFIVDILTWSAFPEDLMAKTNALHFLTERFSINTKHAFLKKMLPTSKPAFSKELANYGVTLDFQEIAVKPFYDSIEYIIACFDLADSHPAYLHFFLDTVFNYTQKHPDGIIGFLSYWQQKKDTLSIVAPESENAIQIMTIHKSKGLEFPCVIYPYANIDIYREIEPKTWLPVLEKDFYGFDEVFINYNKEISEYGVIGEKIVSKRKSQLELDALNLLYVALTRAKEQLYIISKKEINSKGESNPNKFSGKLISYLKHIGKWDDTVLTYDFGSFSRSSQKNTSKNLTTKNFSFTKFNTTQNKHKVHIVTNSSKLWDTTQETAIEKGNLIHNLMASIHTHKDLDNVIKDSIETGVITTQEANLLHHELLKVVNHQELSQFYSENLTVMNEREFMSQGKIYRPDRVIVDKNGWTTIIDYKTGVPEVTHGCLLYTSPSPRDA